MIPEVKLEISLKELSSKGSLIIAQQPEIYYAATIQQVQRLKRTSKVRQSLKKNKPGFRVVLYWPQFVDGKASDGSNLSYGGEVRRGYTCTTIIVM